MTTATDIVIACENRLGYLHHGPLTERRRIEAGKINKKLKTDPSVTLADFELAIEYCWKKRESVTSPVALYWRIKDAKNLANDVVEVSDLTEEIERAIAWEMWCEPIDHEWVGKLTRAQGDGRADVLAEWKAAGRGR